MSDDRRHTTRIHWLETLEKYKLDRDRPGSDRYWSPALDTASRDETIALQNAKLESMVPFLFENSGFYRRRFDQLGLIPTDITTIEDLRKWPVVDKAEMIEDLAQYPPYGTYQTIPEDIWSERGWMLFTSSGSTGLPRSFRYSQIDREVWAWANARALYSMGIRKGDCVLLAGGMGPHVWLWGVTCALAKVGVPVLSGAGLTALARANLIDRYKPTVLACTPSYALYLGRIMHDAGMNPIESSIRTLFIAGEPGMGIDRTRHRLHEIWNARLVEFYGCTEAAPHSGGYSCPASTQPGQPVTTHLMEDLQIWELVSAETRLPVPEGERGLTVCTSLSSESSPQLRFLVGDFTTFDYRTCECGRSHVRAVGSFAGRYDDVINLRGIKFLPGQIEAAVKTVPGVGDEFEIILSTEPDGLDVMLVRVEHPDHRTPDSIAAKIAEAIRSECELRSGVEVLAPDTFPKTEFKAKRVRDLRKTM
jgi:phenylacetate-CoA ligase